MTKPARLLIAASVFALSLAIRPSAAKEGWATLETKHYRIIFEKRNEEVATEILRVAEKVWPTLAKAYQSFDHYRTIEIKVTETGDDANGNAVYTAARVEIYMPHMDWIMRTRRNWIGNVTTHELAHVFSLRRAAWLSPVDEVDVYASTYNYRDKVNYNVSVPWVPLVAPTWYVEGIAQFEAEQNGNDTWDSQRDMLVRDAYLTGTLPTLDFMETFDPNFDWTQSERVYNTGFCFLNYLKQRFGVDRVRALAWPKPLFNFSYSVEKAFGKPLTDLFEDWKRSLADNYAAYKDLPMDPVADADMRGVSQQNLAFSKDGRYMAWLGVDEDRRAPLNWIYWKEVQGGATHKSESPLEKLETPAAAPSKDPSPPPPSPNARGGADYAQTLPGFGFPRLPNPGLTQGLRQDYLLRRSSPSKGAAHASALPAVKERSDEPGSTSLEFSLDGRKLLTTRQDRFAAYTDIWEYEFRGRGSETDKWHRLTWEERAAYPSYHPFRQEIAFSRKQGGTTNLAVLDSNGAIRQLTNFSRGEQVYSPRFNAAGDSIYFTFALGDKEAIAVMPDQAKSFDVLNALGATTAFPDSSNLANGQKLTFVTNLETHAFRDLSFAHDTLFWSSNRGDSAYNVYARLPGDSVIYKATDAATQALEPLAHGGSLYYQGYHRQVFQIYRKPLALAPTAAVLSRPTDTLAILKPSLRNHELFLAYYEMPGLTVGEYTGERFAWNINPFIYLSPTFIGTSDAYTNLALGLNVQLGDPYSDNFNQSLSGAVAKQVDFNTPLDYWINYSGSIGSQPVWHTRFIWPIDLYYSYYHAIYQTTSKALEEDGAFQGTDSIHLANQLRFDTKFTQDAASLAIPLPRLTTSDGESSALLGGYWRQGITQSVRQTQKVTNETTGETLFDGTGEFSVYRNAQEHRNFNAGWAWAWSKGMLGTWLPTGIGVSFAARKWWTAYAVGDDSLGHDYSAQLSQEGEPAAERTLHQASFDPWNVDLSVSGAWSYRKYVTFYADLEGGAFLNRFPMDRFPVAVNGADTVYSEEPAASLWPLTYKMGYVRMRAYPYSFRYQGKDILQGTSMFLGQFGAQIPLRLGAYFPGLPTTSFRQFTLTAMGDLGTVLNRSPDKIFPSLDRGQHQLLADVGVRLAANFRLYHQFPFAAYVEAFQPVNQLKSSDLLSSDYSHKGTTAEAQDANMAADKRRYMRLVKDPRYFVGVQVGVF